MGLIGLERKKKQVELLQVQAAGANQELRILMLEEEIERLKTAKVIQDTKAQEIITELAVK